MLFFHVHVRSSVSWWVNDSPKNVNLLCQNIHMLLCVLLKIFLHELTHAGIKLKWLKIMLVIHMRDLNHAAWVNSR